MLRQKGSIFINFTFLICVFNLFAHLDNLYRYFTFSVEKTHIEDLHLLHSLAQVTVSLITV